LELIRPDGRPGGPHELTEQADQTGAAEPRKASRRVVAELAAQLGHGAWPWPLTVEQQHEDRPVDPVPIPRGVLLIPHGET